MTTFGFTSTADEVLDGIDLHGKRAVVTGASTGLGEETTRALAARGAAITMAVRDLGRGEAAADRVRAAVAGPVELEIRELDLGSLDSVRAFAAAFLAEHDTLDLLINNAGVMACPQGTTTDGFETQFGTNHLGHFLLANLLLPALRAGAPSRVIALTSRGHAFADVDLDDPNFEHQPYDEFIAYGRAKTANALFALGFDRRFADDGVHAYAVHPGGIHTELGRHMTPEVIGRMSERLSSSGRQFNWKSIPQGAASTVWAATAGDLDPHGGAYVEDCHVAEVSEDDSSNGGVRPYARDHGRADRLWELSANLTKAKES